MSDDIRKRLARTTPTGRALFGLAVEAFIRDDTGEDFADIQRLRRKLRANPACDTCGGTGSLANDYVCRDCVAWRKAQEASDE